MMNRRRFVLAALAGTLASPLVTRAQRRPEIGVLDVGTEARSINVSEGLKPFREALRDFGWIDGQNIVLKPRFANLDNERLSMIARELVREEVDVIVAMGTPPTVAARLATATIPIVTSASGDPVAAGLVGDLARPEANVTGTSLIFTEMAAKRLELIRELKPGLSRLAVLSSLTRVSQRSLDEVRSVAPQLGVAVQPFVYRGPDELAGQFTHMRAGKADSLMVVASHTIDEVREPLALLALKHRLPTVCTFRAYVGAGALISYGPDLRAVHRRAAYYVDRLLRGARPVDLPVEQPRTFELVINLKTAKLLGLTIPPSLLARADQVIES